MQKMYRHQREIKNKLYWLLLYKFEQKDAQILNKYYNELLKSMCVKLLSVCSRLTEKNSKKSITF